MPDLPPPLVEAVIVSPPRLAPLGGEAAFSAIRIDPAALARASRVDDALKQAPGASLFRRTGSAAANPTTQGLSLRAIAPSGAGRALVTLDGVPLNDPFGGWVIWSALPPEALDTATIVRGAGAGPYGAGALTGVVALTERGDADGLAAFDLSVGNQASGRIAAVGGAPGLLVSAVAETSDGYVPVRGGRGAADRPLDLESRALAFRVQAPLGGATLAARLSAYEEERGSGLAGARSTVSGGTASLTLARPAPSGLGWRLQAWAQASDLANSSAAVASGRTGTTPANDQYATPARGYGLNAAVQGVGGPVSWEVGGDLRMTSGVERERFRFVGGAFTRGREAGGETLVGGVYVEAARVGERLTLAGGARLDGWRSTGALRRERDLATGAILLDQRAPDASGATPTARLGVRYALTDQLAVRGAAYAGFRPPTLNELHRPFRVGNDITEANPELEPETLQGLELGLSGAWWSLTGFFNRLEDPITNVTLAIGPGTFPVGGVIPEGGVLRQRRNAGAIEAFGLEGEAAGDLGARLAWRAAVSATRAEVDGGAAAPQLTGTRPAQTPRLTATAGLDWRAGERLGLRADARYESARFEDDLNTRKLAAGVQLDLRASWRTGPNAEAYLAIDNALDGRLEVGETADGIESFASPRRLRVGFAYRR